MEDLLKDITYLPGVGPKRAKLLNTELDVYTYKDLIYTFPYKYIDKSRIYKISEIQSTLSHIQLRGKISTFKMVGGNKAKRLVGIFSDGTGTVELVWFKGISWIQKTVQVGVEYLVFGKPSVFNGVINIAHPEMEVIKHGESETGSGLFPQYNTSEKLKNNYITSKTLAKITLSLLKVSLPNIKETLPESILSSQKLMPLKNALKQLHFPDNNELLKKANYRVKFEELFYLQLSIARLKFNRNTKFKGHVFSNVGILLNSFYNNNLQFELTGAQKRVIKEIRKDMATGMQMNRLLQGDVGSGKTLVALMCMLIALDNGYQACLMAPTEILAQQHFKTIKQMLDGLDVHLMLLTGSTKKRERELIKSGLSSGELHIVIGTHALLEDYVQFSDLGFVVIDEQHRFGVAQRAKLWKKNAIPPHVLVMTATPIPRTLAMTVYGDLDVSVIDELPPGRIPITTAHYYDSKRLAMFGFVRKAIAEGRQAYVVYPLIKESEAMDYKDLEDGYAAISQAFPAPEYTVVCVHGKMKPKDKEEAMQLFASGKAHIMVATTVIEVGVDVPNASVMVIESAERFGLSQLHQLRGRVGRGANKSYCILMTSYKLTNDGRKRIETMVKSTDGFEIAEVDMKIRGPGDLEGTQQSGLAFDLKLANLTRDTQLMEHVRHLAIRILEEDPELAKPENQLLKSQLKEMKQPGFNWGVIS